MNMCPVTSRDGEMPLEKLPMPQRIKQARKRAGFTNQEAFANALGMKTKRTVTRWETGENKPDPEYASKIAETTSQPVELFLSSTDTFSDRLTEIERQLAGLASKVARLLREDDPDVPVQQRSA